MRFNEQCYECGCMRRLHEATFRADECVCAVFVPEPEPDIEGVPI